ncbi:MAG TPA: hypothetical protein VIE43_06495 [Thermoanaerobaculia bacterium]|nr:hypothetical protein [Thermoanaerobaculia bacterium]
MRAPHLLRVEESPEKFAPLIAAARALGLRVGWLELAGKAHPVPPFLEVAAGLGVMRAVEVGDGRTVAVKPMRGAAVLEDLLREHFRGCALVLVRGEVDAPSLAAEGEGWRFTLPGVAPRLLTTDQLASFLRKAHPWKQRS